MASIKKQIIKLEQHIHKKILELKARFYISRRSNYVHMGIDEPVFSFTNYANVIAEINFCKGKFK